MPFVESQVRVRPRPGPLHNLPKSLQATLLSGCFDPHFYKEEIEAHPFALGLWQAAVEARACAHPTLLSGVPLGVK